MISHIDRPAFAVVLSVPSPSEDTTVDSAAAEISLQVWSLLGEADKSVWLLEGTLSAELDAADAAWRERVLRPLATMGCPAAAAALLACGDGAGGASHVARASATGGLFLMPRLPPPREDDPDFNTPLRLAMAALRLDGDLALSSDARSAISSASNEADFEVF